MCSSLQPWECASSPSMPCPRGGSSWQARDNMLTNVAHGPLQHCTTCAAWPPLGQCTPRRGAPPLCHVKPLPGSQPCLYCVLLPHAAAFCVRGECQVWDPCQGGAGQLMGGDCQLLCGQHLVSIEQCFDCCGSLCPNFMAGLP